MKLVIVPLALAELHDAAAFYTARASVELGLAFVTEFERTAKLVLDTGQNASSESLSFHCRMTPNKLLVTDTRQTETAWRRLLRAG